MYAKPSRLLGRYFIVSSLQSKELTPKINVHIHMSNNNSKKNLNENQTLHKHQTICIRTVKYQNIIWIEMYFKFWFLMLFLTFSKILYHLTQAMRWLISLNFVCELLLYLIIVEYVYVRIVCLLPLLFILMIHGRVDVVKCCIISTL